MAKSIQHSLSRRERQIMDILYRLGPASVGEVMDELSGKPTYSTVRAQLRVLEEKGHIKHEERGPRYVYLPRVSRRTERQSALRHLIDTFFEGSSGQVMAALIGDERTKLSAEEIRQLRELLANARKGGNK
jgi:predicted transcriptional regulator